MYFWSSVEQSPQSAFSQPQQCRRPLSAGRTFSLSVYLSQRGQYRMYISICKQFQHGCKILPSRYRPIILCLSHFLQPYLAHFIYFGTTFRIVPAIKKSLHIPIIPAVLIMMQTQNQYPSTKTIKTLYSQLESAYQRREGPRLAQLLREIYTDPAYNVNAERWKLSLSSDRYGGGNAGVLFGKMLETIRQYQVEKLKKGVHFAFRLHLEVISHVLKIIEEIKDESMLWLCWPLRQVIRSTKRIFLAASKQDKESGGGEAIKKDTVIIKLQEFKAKRSLIDQVKRQILPLIDNLQVSILFLYHNYDQIIRIIDNPKAYGEHGPAFVDNYNFQKGKAALIYQKFEAAEKYFESINIRTVGQKRLVLKYLIPCKMFLGKTFVPSPNRPEEHFPEYVQLSESLHCAKLSDYTEAITKYQKVWIKRGIYLLMDELRIILWRNLIKKVHRILEDDKIKLEKIHMAVKLSGGSESLEQCMCIISNLIYEGYIKGYIFQNEEHRVLVVKRGGEGFPALSKLAAS